MSVTRYEAQMYADVSSAARSLKSIAETMKAMLPHIEVKAQFTEDAADLTDQKIQNVFHNVHQAFELAFRSAFTDERNLIGIDKLDEILTTVEDAVTNNFDRLTEPPNGD